MNAEPKTADLFPQLRGIRDRSLNPLGLPLATLLNDLTTLLAVVEGIAPLHLRTPGGWCRTCGTTKDWPCATVRTIQAVLNWPN